MCLDLKQHGDSDNFWAACGGFGYTSFASETLKNFQQYKSGPSKQT